MNREKLANSVEVDLTVSDLGDKIILARIDYLCPSCKTSIIYTDEKNHDNYCPGCGAKIEWKNTNKL